MGGAVGLNLLTFRTILRRKRPLLEPTFSMPTKKDITSNLYVREMVGEGV